MEPSSTYLPSAGYSHDTMSKLLNNIRWLLYRLASVQTFDTDDSTPLQGILQRGLLKIKLWLSHTTVISNWSYSTLKYTFATCQCITELFEVVLEWIHGIDRQEDAHAFLDANHTTHNSSDRGNTTPIVLLNSRLRPRRHLPANDQLR